MNIMTNKGFSGGSSGSGGSSSVIKNEINNKNNSDVVNLIEKKLNFFKDVIQKTIIYTRYFRN